MVIKSLQVTQAPTDYVRVHYTQQPFGNSNAMSFYFYLFYIAMANLQNNNLFGVLFFVLSFVVTTFRWVCILVKEFKFHIYEFTNISLLIYNFFFFNPKSTKKQPVLSPHSPKTSQKPPKNHPKNSQKPPKNLQKPPKIIPNNHLNHRLPILFYITSQNHLNLSKRHITRNLFAWSSNFQQNLQSLQKLLNSKPPKPSTPP